MKEPLNSDKLRRASLPWIKSVYKNLPRLFLHVEPKSSNDNISHNINNLQIADAELQQLLKSRKTRNSKKDHVEEKPIAKPISIYSPVYFIN